MHEGLWLVIGTVAPVVALGNTVTIMKSVEILNGINVVRKVKPWMWPTAFQVTKFMGRAAWFGLGLCILTLFCAVLSLATDSDVYSAQIPYIFSPAAQGIFSAASVVFLIPPLWAETWIRGYNFFTEEVAEARGLMAKEYDRTYENIDYETLKAMKAIKDRPYPRPSGQ